MLPQQTLSTQCVLAHMLSAVHAVPAPRRATHMLDALQKSAALQSESLAQLVRHAAEAQT